MRRSTSCLMCKKNCEKNQKVSCSKCKRYAHIKCANVGLNFGNHNFVCKVCHQKRASKPNSNSSFSSLPSFSPLDHSVSNFSGNVSNISKIDPTSSYLSFSMLNSKLNTKTISDIFVLHLNIGSLVLNIDRIKSIISHSKVRPDVVCVTESRLMDTKIDWQLKLVQIDGYFIPDVTYDNSPTNAGGVVVYFHDSLRQYVKHKPDLRLDVPACESVFFELESGTQNKKKLLIGCIYRHPRKKKSVVTSFLQKMSEMLEKQANNNTPLLILGDININVNDNSENVVQQYSNLLSSVGCRNIIDIPTHFWKTGQSTLDHVISNIDSDMIDGGVLNNGEKGHLPTVAIVKNHFESPPSDKNDKEKWRFIDERHKDKFLSILEKNLSNISLIK